MSEDNRLPLEKLKDKYIPVSEFPERYGIDVADVMKLIQERRIRYAEFKAPGAMRRSTHVNYEEVLAILEKEE